MKISIGIVTRNRAEILPKAIRSAIAQDHADKEVLVFDDGSNDATAELRGQFPSVRWIRRDVSVGCMAARNYLMSIASGELFCSLDDDAWFLGTDELRVAAALFEERPDVAAAAFDILSPDRGTPGARKPPVLYHQFIGCGHVLRVTDVRDVGYYIETPGLYGSEETDLSIRLLDRGREIVYMPGVHVWHEKTNVARDRNAQYRSVVCNDLHFALRRFPSPIVFWKLPGKAVSHLRFALGHGLVRPYLQGILMFARHGRAAYLARKPVRRTTVREYYRRVVLEAR